MSVLGDSGLTNQLFYRDDHLTIGLRILTGQPG